MSNLCELPISDYRKKYGLTAFVETGSEYGDGIDMALRAGYGKIYSCEIVLKLYEYCINKYVGDNRVSLFWGDSGQILWKVLEKVKDDKCLFWLDAHLPHLRSSEKYDGDQILPLKNELALIKEMRDTKRDVFIIDDLPLYDECLRAKERTKEWWEKWVGIPTNITLKEILKSFVNHEAEIVETSDIALVLLPKGNI